MSKIWEAGKRPEEKVNVAKTGHRCCRPTQGHTQYQIRISGYVCIIIATFFSPSIHPPTQSNHRSPDLMPSFSRLSSSVITPIPSPFRPGPTINLQPIQKPSHHKTILHAIQKRKPHPSESPGYQEIKYRKRLPRPLETEQKIIRSKTADRNLSGNGSLGRS